MTTPKIKFDKFIIILVCAWIFTLAILAYEGYFLYGLYNQINAPSLAMVAQHVVKINQAGLNQADARYTAAQNYTFTGTTVPNPF